MEYIPNEIIEHIFQYLNPIDLLDTCRLVNRHWNYLILNISPVYTNKWIKHFAQIVLSTGYWKTHKLTIIYYNQHGFHEKIFRNCVDANDIFDLLPSIVYIKKKYNRRSNEYVFADFNRKMEWNQLLAKFWFLKKTIVKGDIFGILRLKKMIEISPWINPQFLIFILTHRYFSNHFLDSEMIKSYYFGKKFNCTQYDFRDLKNMEFDLAYWRFMNKKIVIGLDYWYHSGHSNGIGELNKIIQPHTKQIKLGPFFHFEIS